MEDNRICQICDGGPGNNCACTCGYRKWELGMTYSGICIGGPMDGQRITTQTPSFDVMERKPVPFSCDEAPDTKAFEITMVKYVFQFVPIVSGIVPFFVPEGQTYDETLKRLIENYRP